MRKVKASTCMLYGGKSNAKSMHKNSRISYIVAFLFCMAFWNCGAGQYVVIDYIEINKSNNWDLCAKKMLQCLVNLHQLSHVCLILFWCIFYVFYVYIFKKFDSSLRIFVWFFVWRTKFRDIFKKFGLSLRIFDIF